MAEFKVVLSTKDGKSFQRELKDDQAKILVGKKIGDEVKGDSMGFEGYVLKISGGSDKAGFPMRRDLSGTLRKKILAVGGVGIKQKRSGQRQRKMVCGNTVHAGIAQINLKVITEGKQKLEAPKAEEAKK